MARRSRPASGPVPKRETPQERVLPGCRRPRGQFDRAGDAKVSRAAALRRRKAMRRTNYPPPAAATPGTNTREQLDRILVRAELVVQAGADDGELVVAATDAAVDARNVGRAVDHERALVAGAAVEVHVQAFDLERHRRRAEEV